MCGVIGLIHKFPDSKPFPVQLLRSMTNEAQIRGQHATGCATIAASNYIDHNSLSVPASLFPLEEMFHRDFIQAAIVHCRYSTSDLSYNQPMVAYDLASMEADIALIHNGVVSQAAAETWKETYNVECATRNDSEILLRIYEQDGHPLNVRPSSQACIVLDAIDETVAFWRNEKRPLYFVDSKEYIAIASTQDILLRSGAGDESEIQKCQPCVDYRVYLEETPFRLEATQIRIPDYDIQH